MKARQIDGNSVGFFCPGCQMTHVVPYATGGNIDWTWNGSLDKPTLSPSILTNYTLYGPEKKPFGKYEGPMPCETELATCHSFITDGRIAFLPDSTHALAGQTIDLPEWEDNR